MMRRRAVWAFCLGVALAATTGCRVIVELVESEPGSASSVDGGDGDARGGPDAYAGPDADTNCASWSFVPLHFDLCAAPAPAGPLILATGQWTYDTNSGALTDPDQDVTFPASALVPQTGGPELRLLSVSAFDVQQEAALLVFGKRPLVVVSWTEVSVAGRVDVTGSVDRPGAGADPSECSMNLPVVGAEDVEGAGGGGGGGFGDAGGDGGTGNDAAAAGGQGGAAVPTPTVLRGGCAGAAGGGTLAGAGGFGGGALHMTARNSIDITGVVAAGGQGGGASQGARSGGGGGGSGGSIGLEAATITVGATGILAANGGGGGGGSDNNAASPGAPASPDALAAPGGKREGMGGDGGDGGALGVAAEPGKAARRGGGGGGGGVGLLRLYGAMQNIDAASVLSPAPTDP